MTNQVGNSLCLFVEFKNHGFHAKLKLITGAGSQQPINCSTRHAQRPSSSSKLASCVLPPKHSCWVGIWSGKRGLYSCTRVNRPQASRPRWNQQRISARFNSPSCRRTHGESPSPARRPLIVQLAPCFEGWNQRELFSVSNSKLPPYQSTCKLSFLV